jgi:lipid-A-disaccharide synthase
MQINNFNSDAEWKSEFLAKDSRKIIAILPGSRKQEVETVLNEMIQLKNQFTNYRLVVAGVDNLDNELYKNAFENNIEVVYSKTYDLLSVAKAAVVTSGTATLETALFNVPQVVCYKTSTISYHIAKQLIKVKYISLVNLIAEKEAVKELIQDDFNAKNIAFELEKLLSVEKRDEMLANYKLVRNKLGDSPASVNSAKYIADFLA